MVQCTAWIVVLAHENLSWELAANFAHEDSALLRRRYDEGLNDYTYLRDEG